MRVDALSGVAAGRGSYPESSNIRGRSGFDVVGSPVELRAEVAGWPRKSTGTNASAKNDLALAA
jgi:hypothetical protein